MPDQWLYTGLHAKARYVAQRGHWCTYMPEVHDHEA
jgi:hypothetical protein